MIMIECEPHIETDILELLLYSFVDDSYDNNFKSFDIYSNFYKDPVFEKYSSLVRLHFKDLDASQLPQKTIKNYQNIISCQSL